MRELDSFKKQYYAASGKLQEAEIKLEGLYSLENKLEMLGNEKDALIKSLKQKNEENKNLNNNIDLLKEEISKLRQNEQQKTKAEG